MQKFTKHLAVAAISLATLALSACMSSGERSVGSTDNGYATVVVQTKASNVNQLSKPGLGKSATITLDSMYVTAISDAVTPDTVIVKLGVDDSGFSATATSDQNISILLNLKALRNWTITAKTLDVNDSIIQTGSVVTGNLFAGQTKVVTLNAKPRYKIYTATFNMPDSVFSPSGNFGQNISLSKVEMWIKGAKRDEAAGTLKPDTNYVLSYDYTDTTVVAGDSLTLKVYGSIDSASDVDPATESAWNTGSHLLYSRTVAISTLTAVYPAVNTVALNWQGPVTGHVDLTVSVQKVGTTAVNGTTDPTVLSKK
jgi:hypothetical protein